MGYPGDPAETFTDLTVLAQRATRRGEDFFVAGGPVAPDRACYIPRATDQELYERLRAGEYCHIIAPRFSGKTSLMARTASRLRAEGRLAAVVDLSQLGSRDGSTEVGRWYYGLAYRVVRDLRLKLDLQSWWQERMPLPPPQRLGEFFWEIVIGATRAPVTVFLDEIDSVEQLDYATELFSIVRACHDARAGEPEYQRLNFALLGTALPGGAASVAGEAATEIGTRLELPDFRFDEVRPLAEGLGLAPGDAERALYRIMYWTGGHPYLTQKLCQAVARNAARIDSDDAVDRLVAARFLARNMATSETSMSRVLDGLDRAGKLARPALRLYRRIRRGRRPGYAPGNPQHELLRVCGLVNVTKDRRLVVRNRIYAEVFTHRWAREALPVEWGKMGRAALLAALVIGAAWSYVEVLPRPFEETLRVASVDLDEAVQAWSAMRRLPGFGARADRLLARVLVRASRETVSWPAAEAIDARLRALPGFQPRADALLVEYWERRAAEAEAAERRDEALLYRLRAYVAGPTADAGRAAELAGGDYRHLRTIIRPAGVVEGIARSTTGGSLVTVSAGHVVERWNLADGLPEVGGRLELLAEEFVPVRRRLSLDAPGRVGDIRLELELDHPRPRDLHAVLFSPAGTVVAFSLADITVRDGQVVVVDPARAPALRALRGEPTLGTWQLELEDREGGEPGFLARWRLQASPAAAHRAEDRPENPLLLPTPARSSAVRVALSPGGSKVAALPRNPDARGRLHTWDTRTGEALARVDVSAGQRWLGFAAEDVLLLVEADVPGERLRVIDAASGEQQFAHRAAGRYAAGPAISADGRYLAMAETAPKIAWIRELESGREVFQLSLAGEASALAVASGAMQLAVADAGDVVRVWHARDSALLTEYPHAAPVVAMAFDPAGRWLATAGLDRQLRVWDLSSREPLPSLWRPVGDTRTFGFDALGRRLAVMDPAGGYEVWALPESEPYGPILRHGGARVPPPAGSPRRADPQPVLVEEGLLVGGLGTRSVSVWQLAPESEPVDLPRIAPLVTLAPSGLRMAAGMTDGRVLLRTRDPESLRLEQTRVTAGEYRHGGVVTALAFSPDGSRLVSVGIDGSVLLWNAASGNHLGRLFQHGGGRVAAIELGPDNRLLVTGGELGARTWDAETGTPGPALGPGRVVSAVAIDPAGLRAFTGTPQGEVESWDVATGERLWFGTIEAPVDQLAVSGDGLRVAAASSSGQVRAWGLGPGGRSQEITLAAPVVDLLFTPDGTALLAQTHAWLHRIAMVDGRLRVVASRMLPAAIPPGAWRSAVADGRRIVLVGGAHSETMASLDFDRAPLPPENWRADLEGWQHRLKLYFADDGELHGGAPWGLLADTTTAGGGEPGL